MWSILDLFYFKSNLKSLNIWSCLQEYEAQLKDREHVVFHTRQTWDNWPHGGATSTICFSFLSSLDQLSITELHSCSSWKSQEASCSIHLDSDTVTTLWDSFFLLSITVTRDELLKWNLCNFHYWFTQRSADTETDCKKKLRFKM